jgi:hypothetical protein
MRFFRLSVCAPILLALQVFAQEISIPNRCLEYRDKEFTICYPENWHAFGDKDSTGLIVAPPEAIRKDPAGAMNVGYGAVISTFYPEGKVKLEKVTHQLIERLQSSNRGMKLAADNHMRTRVDGRPALITVLAAPSSCYPGQTEIDRLVTVPMQRRLFYIIFIAPQNAITKLQPLFDKMLSSVKLTHGK